MLRSIYIFIIGFIALILPACQRAQSAVEAGDTIPMTYAHNLTLVEHDGWTMAEMRNPWDTTKVLHRYALVGKNDVKVPDGLTVVHVPLRRAAVFTSVLCGLMNDLGGEDAIGGVCDASYISLPIVQQGLKDGSIADLGNAMDPNIERIMDLQPDALLPSPFQNSGGYGRLERIGIPIVECADYMEVSPLARAEWMRFYGRLFGVGAKADSLFSTIEGRYLALREKAQNVRHRPRLMAESLSGNTWFTPGGQSTMGILYRDAGTDYLWADTPESGSLSLSIEAVMERAIDADIWIMKYNAPTAMDYELLAKENALYTRFRPFRERRIFACNTQQVPYYEETPFHPDLLLANLLQIFHPELGIVAEKSYFCNIKSE